MRGFLLAATAACAMSACALPPEDEDNYEDPGMTDVDKADGDKVTVGDWAGETCSTESVNGLSNQIILMMSTTATGGLVHLSPSGRITFASDRIRPYFASTAHASLVALAATEGADIVITSGFRTVADQFIIYEAFRKKRKGCGITAAARPGNSNHESGRAIDVRNYAVVGEGLRAVSWASDVPRDKVHFEHTLTVDAASDDVLAFQRLWNRNHAQDKIIESAIFDDATEARMRLSPAAGFEKGPSL